MTGRPRVLVVSVTEAGRAMAHRLPFEHVHGSAAATVRERWADVDAFVLLLATGAAVRIVAPLLTDKATDPAVVCVDEAGRFAVALCGGHAGGANRLAGEVASLLGAQAVVTTATDAAGVPALDDLPGLIAVGDVAGVTTAMLDRRPVHVDNRLAWPLPAPLQSFCEDLSVSRTEKPSQNGGLGQPTPPPPAGAAFCEDPPVSGAERSSQNERGAGRGAPVVVVTDEVVGPSAGVVALHPPSLVVGVGSSSGAPADEVAALVRAALTEAGLARQSVAEVATADIKATEPGIVALGLPLRTFAAEALAAVDVPTPSDVVQAAVGTPSVAEAAALLAAGPGARLVVTKRRSAMATVAVARRAGPRGHLAIVGLGPGGAAHRTPAAATAVRAADVVIGYGPYVDQCADLLTPAHEVVRSPIGDEVVRAKQALTDAAAGRRVALVCSGDAGVYAMASIALELAGEEAPGLDVDVVPGVTAALAASAALGAPLGHDHVSISLSDLLTPWDAIERRLRAAAEADLVVTLYNPRSRGRDWQLGAARDILLAHRAPSTPVGIVTDAARPGEQVHVTTLGDLDVELVGMTTCVVIGSSTTAVVDGRIVTPRGYRP